MKIEEPEVIYYYLKLNDTQITAKLFGVSDETIRRILIRNQIPRTGFKDGKKKEVKEPRPRKPTDKEIKLIVDDYYNTDGTMVSIGKKYHRSQEAVRQVIREYGHGIKFCERNSPKISNEELFAEICKGSNCNSIARRYNTTPENIYRRARKMGFILSSAGWGGHYYKRCKHYNQCDGFDESITLDAVITKYDGICQLCGQKVDETDIVNGHIRKRYPSVDHIIPLSKGGTHTWDNVQLAHMGCNAGKCDRTDYTVKAKGV